MNEKEKRESAEAEVARLENIVTIQQKQIERLMQARDIDVRRLDILHELHVNLQIAENVAGNIETFMVAACRANIDKLAADHGRPIC